MAGTKLNPLFRGDGRQYTLTFTDSEGVVIKIEGWTVYFTLKKYAWMSDDEADVKKDITEHTNPSQGETKIILSSSDTVDLRARVYRFDIQIKKGDGTIITILSGTLEIKADITRRVI